MRLSSPRGRVELKAGFVGFGGERGGEGEERIDDERRQRTAVVDRIATLCWGGNSVRPVRFDKNRNRSYIHFFLPFVEGKAPSEAMPPLLLIEVHRQGATATTSHNMRPEPR